MNLLKLKGNVGKRLRFVPPATCLDVTGTVRTATTSGPSLRSSVPASAFPVEWYPRLATATSRERQRWEPEQTGA